MMPTENKKKYWFQQNLSPSITLVIILLIAIGIRLPAIFQVSMTGDEVSTVFQADFPLLKMIHRLAITDIADADIAPPFYFVILNFLIREFHFSILQLKFSSIFFDLISILFIFFFTRKKIEENIALSSSLFVALSPFQIWYGTEIRMYALVALLSIISTLSFVFYLDQRKRFYLILYGISSLMGIYTQYYFFLLLAAQFITLIIYWHLFKVKLFPIFAVYTLMALLFIPWLQPLLIDLKVLQTHSSATQPLPFFAFIYVFIKLFLFGNSYYVRTHIVLYSVGSLLILFIIGIFFNQWKKHTNFTKILFSIFIISFSMLTVISILKPQSLRPHAAIFLLPLGLLLVAITIGKQTKILFNIRLLLYGFWAIILVSYNYNPLFTKAPVRDGADIICRINTEKSPLFNLPLQIPCPDNVFPGSFQLWQYYLKNRSEIFFLNGKTVDDILYKLERETTRVNHFYIVFYDFFQRPKFYNSFFSRIETKFDCMFSYKLNSAVDGNIITIKEYRKKSMPKNLDRQR